LPVLLDAASFAVSAGLLTLALRPVRRLGRHGPVRDDDEFALQEPTKDGRHPSFVGQIRDGLAWLVREPRVRLLCSLNASLAFCQWLGFGVLVIYCTRVLHLGAVGFGVFSAAGASGNTVGAWAAPRVDAKLGPGRTLLLAGLACGLGFIVVGTTTNVAAAVAALWTEALAVGVGRVAIIALRQRITPLELAGRVSAVIRATVVGAGAIATLLGGALVVVINPHAPFAIGGALQMIAAIVLGGALVRRLASADEDVVDVTDAIDLREQPVEVP
jgi:hypothetical protein